MIPHTHTGGEINIQDIGFEEFMGPDGHTSHFALTCVSTGGPVTNSYWQLDAQELEGEGEIVFDDPVTAQYTQTLTVTGRTEGEYSCVVSNTKPFVNIEFLTVTGIYEKHSLNLPELL